MKAPLSAQPSRQVLSGIRDEVDATANRATDPRRRLRQGEAASGEAALEAVAEFCPRLVIIDNRMPGMSGIEATRLLSARHPDVVVVLVSAEAFEDPAARSCGAAAFACKHDLSPRLLRELWRNHGS